MNREQKQAAVQKMNEGFQKNPNLVLASFSGLTVNQVNSLRRKVDEIGGHYEVVKNRLAKRAAAGTPLEPLAEKFTGPCALAFHESDPVGLAKTITAFAKENPQLEVVAGLVDAKDLVDADGVKQLATLPGLPELRAQLLALIQTPATSLARLLNTPAGQMARVVDAHREAREKTESD